MSDFEVEKKKKKKLQEAKNSKLFLLTSVADPFPALAVTTSVPPSCVRVVRASSFAPRSLMGVA